MALSVSATLNALLLPAVRHTHARRPVPLYVGKSLSSWSRLWHPYIQELLGHRDVCTAMIYRHVLNQGGRGVRSPLDQLRPGSGVRWGYGATVRRLLPAIEIFRSGPTSTARSSMSP